MPEQSETCGRTAPHPSHKFMQGRHVSRCSGAAPSSPVGVSAVDQLAPFRALADRYAAKAAESTRHAKIADDDEKRLSTQGIAAGWRSAEFLLRHTLTDLDNSRTTPDNPATLPAQSRRPDLTIRLGKATEETFRIHLAQFGIDTPGCDCGHNEMGVEWHATDCQWRTSRTTPDNPTGSAFPDVRGRCPACRGESLFVGSGGYITCARRECPEPDAASTLLERVPDNIAAEAIAARRRALARNAVGAVLNTHGQWLPLSVREAVADAVLDQRIDDALNGPTEPTS